MANHLIVSALHAFAFCLFPSLDCNSYSNPDAEGRGMEQVQSHVSWCLLGGMDEIVACYVVLHW